MGHQTKKIKEPDVLLTVDSKTLLDILNNIDGIMPFTHPVVFRPVDCAGEKGTIFRAGVDSEDHFIWKDDDVLGNIMFINVEIWENNRIEDLFTNYLGDDGKFEILEGSFTGELLHF